MGSLQIRRPKGLSETSLAEQATYHAFLINMSDSENAIKQNNTGLLGG
jgi:hypothetical protein